MSENCIKKSYFGERGVANIILSSNINGEISICLEDEQDGVKSSWEMIMCEEDAKKVALRLAKITGIVSHDATVNNAQPVAERPIHCKDCKYTVLSKDGKTLICCMTMKVGTVRPDFYCGNGEMKGGAE